ncbi:hypothetical protein BO94DRAFT_357028 [Aspergillus sclerotioniger CBS 115572]|uniref:Uncharacterized protein n=1 Tax=Aspergillus sclerotioniger CBS 115572 TaxID=1450535 RepID=A0A317URY5_9EURO|nr:hypothetical protein BO94DRAFT_357028 [Aspergillus sclerotioniger CBS 115572]PWY64724.1 hypothetical protein BO94DRAFT_357028 [Aspergillus sclerotioniger CBS 115572]
MLVATVISTMLSPPPSPSSNGAIPTSSLIQHPPMSPHLSVLFPTPLHSLLTPSSVENPTFLSRDPRFPTYHVPAFHDLIPLVPLSPHSPLPVSNATNPASPIPDLVPSLPPPPHPSLPPLPQQHPHPTPPNPPRPQPTPYPYPYPHPNPPPFSSTLFPPHN